MFVGLCGCPSVSCGGSFAFCCSAETQRPSILVLAERRCLFGFAASSAAPWPLSLSPVFVALAVADQPSPRRSSLLSRGGPLARMAATFFPCPEDCSLSQLAARFAVRSYDVWLPLGAYAAARRKRTAAVDISDTTPIVLRDQSSGELFPRRDDVLMKLCMLDEHGTKGLRIAPSSVPPLYELFVRWDKASGAKRVAAGTVVMHWAITDAQALANGSIVELSEAAIGPRGTPAEEVRQRRQDGTADRRRHRHQHHQRSVDGSTLAESVREAQQAVDYYSRAADELEERLVDVVAKRRRCEGGAAAAPESGGGDGGPSASVDIQQASAVRHYALSRILQCKDLPPLHLLAHHLRGPSSLELPSGVLWERPDPRVLCRVFRSKASAEKSASSKYTDASRQVAFFLAQDVLLCNDRLDSAEGPQQEAAAVVEQRRRKALAAMARYAARAYRIVVLDHFPDLHHGSAFSAEERLTPLVRLLQTECTAAFTVTVVLSVVSYITVGQRRGISASFVLPNTGLLQFFSSELNASLQLDGSTSLLVGTRHRGNPFLDGMHATFAANASLAFVEVDDLVAA